MLSSTYLETIQIKCFIEPSSSHIPLYCALLHSIRISLLIAKQIVHFNLCFLSYGMGFPSITNKFYVFQNSRRLYRNTRKLWRRLIAWYTRVVWTIIIFLISWMMRIWWMAPQWTRSWISLMWRRSCRVRWRMYVQGVAGIWDTIIIISFSLQVRRDSSRVSDDVYTLKLKLSNLEPEMDSKFGLAEENSESL